MSALSDTTKAALAAAKEKRGKTPAALLEHQKSTGRLQKAILEVLSEPATVPEIASKTGINAAQVLFQINAMRKYGKVEDAGKSGDYLRYRAREGSA